MGYVMGIEGSRNPHSLSAPTDDKKKQQQNDDPWLRDYLIVAMTMLTNRSFYHFNGDGHFLLQKSKKIYIACSFGSKIGL